MSWYDDWWEVGLDFLTFGSYSAAKGATIVATGVAQGAAGVSVNTGTRSSGGIRPPDPLEIRDKLPQTPAAVPAPGGGCCERFKLESGFLLDTGTGQVWQFDPNAGAFRSVPRQFGGDERDLAEILLEKQLEQIKEKYSREVLDTLPARSRAAQMSAFDKGYLEPIRRARLGKSRAK